MGPKQRAEFAAVCRDEPVGPGNPEAAASRKVAVRDYLTVISRLHLIVNHPS
jgi:hypothetical protein